MSVEEKIVQFGKDHIWQNPRRDRNIILQLSKISPKNGYINWGKVHHDKIVCPTKTNYYHFYQIGGNSPNVFGLFSMKEKWFKLSDWCKEYKLIIHFYNKIGKCIPTSEVYMYRMQNDNIIFAVLANGNRIIDLNEEKLFVHFYRNYYYSTALEDDSADHIIYSGSVHGGKKNNRDLLNLFQFNKLKKKGGQYLIHNGYMVDSFDPSKLEEGDMTEVLFDYSIRKVWDLKVSELRTYKSTLDAKTKYLIHPPKQSDDNIINYRDDIDIFVYKKDPKTKQVKGLYYHRNMEDSVRMVTHRDYGLPVAYVMDYIQALDPHYDLNDFYIRVFVRQNGPIKPLVTDINKLRSLYVLPDDKIINAMVQVNSTLKEWTADYLERSAYTAVMRSYREELTPALILDATGYTEAAKLLANPNILITKDANGNYFKLPDGLHKEVTVFEYNRNGMLLGWYNQDQYRKYYPYNKDCVFIEAIAGKGGDDITINLTNKPFKLKENTAYRFYLAEVANNEISSEWKDNTADPRILVDLPNMECTYGFKNSGEAGVAIGDDKFLCYNQELDIRDGILDFQLTYEKEHSKALIIPPGKIDIWLNGHALVEDIDYFVDFPNVMIVSKAYIIDDKSKQSVTVRCTGFPFSIGDTLKRVKPREVGFIQYGKVSVDQHHDLHDDRLIRCVVDGGVFDPSVITFDEEGDAEVSRFALDGKPYSIETPYVSLGGALGVNLYQAQIKDYELSLRIGDYLTEHLPKDKYRLPPVIHQLYRVYSPFLSAISTDLKYGRLMSPPLKTDVLDIDKIVARYKKYLTMDPALRGFDEHFVNIHAHCQNTYMELTARDIAFLNKLNDLYLKGKVDISKFYRVKKG